MNGSLAIMTPRLGELSETFIRRQIESLASGQTVCIAKQMAANAGASWKATVPTLLLSSPRRNPTYTALEVRLRGVLGLSSREDHLTRRFLRTHRVEVVLGQWLNHSAEWVHPVKELGIRFFAHGHGFDISERWLEQGNVREQYAALRDADGIIVPTATSRDRLIALGFSAEHVHQIPYGIEIPLRFKSHAPAETIRFLAVGRMVGKKGTIFLLEAFRLALLQGVRIGLDLVGDGELMPGVLQFIRATRIEDHVKVHGSVPYGRVLQMFLEADGFAMHSVTDPVTGDQEGLPLVLLEALGHGLPVVATAHEGIREAVRDGVEGFLVEEGDVWTMADRLVQLARDHELRARLGMAGRERAQEYYSWDRERAELRQLLGLREATPDGVGS